MVLGRQVVLLSKQGQLECEAEASRKQAEGTPAQAKKVLDEASNEDKKAFGMAAELAKPKEELNKAKTDMTVMKKQTSSTDVTLQIHVLIMNSMKLVIRVVIECLSISKPNQ